MNHTTILSYIKNEELEPWLLYKYDDQKVLLKKIVYQKFMRLNNVYDLRNVFILGDRLNRGSKYLQELN